MDVEVRTHQRKDDLTSRTRFLRSLLRSCHLTNIKLKIEFAAFMGDLAAKEAIDYGGVRFSLRPNKLDEKQKKLRPWTKQPIEVKIWQQWKRFTRVLGKAPALIACIPCVDYVADQKPGIQHELKQHLQARAENKNYTVRLQHPYLRDCRHRWTEAWGMYETQDQISDREFIWNFIWLMGGCQNYAATSAEIMGGVEHIITSSYVGQRSGADLLGHGPRAAKKTLAMMKRDIQALTDRISQSCAAWALDIDL